MAHARPDQLETLQDTLDAVRAWPRIKEKSRNVFYLGTKAFLHFHSDGTRLWADVKRPDGEWTELGATTKLERGRLLKQIENHYFALMRGA